MCQHDRLMEAAREFRELGARLSNWERWGPDDRVGTLNYLTPERRLAAREEIRHGRAINLGLPISANGIQIGMGGRINPVHLMSMTHNDLKDRPDGWFAADDFIFMPLQSVTQWDGLGHVGYDDRLYNDVPADSLTTAGGSLELSITQITEHGVAGRGVLLDIARLRGVERMKAGEKITPEDLSAAAARQNVEIRSGDILLIRTGWLRNFTVDGDARSYWDGEPGLTLECAEWLHDHEIAAVASDNWAVEVQDAGMTDFIIPFHCVTIRDMGMTLGEIFVLDELGDACAEAGHWSFFFSAPALPVVGGVGSPIAPLAIL